MKSLTQLKDTIFESFGNMLTGAAELLPQILLGILGLLIAWLLIKIVLFILKKILKTAKIDTLSQRVADVKLFGDRELKIDLLKVILTTVRILLILLFTDILAGVLGLNAISDTIRSLVGYLPTLFSSLLILAGGLYLASLVKKATKNLFDSMGISGSKIISVTLFYLITFFMSITALNQAGIDTQIITSNFTLVLGAFLLAAALGIGLGSKDVFSDVLKMFYARKTYMVGDEIAFGDLEGTVVAIDNITMTLKTKKGKVIIPINEVVTQIVTFKS